MNEMQRSWKRSRDEAHGQTRRAALVAMGVALAAPFARAQGGPIEVEIWKSPSCGCCQDWVDHLEANGFRVTVHDEGNTAARRRLGIPSTLGSCHTARIGKYAAEGHVPAADLKRLLRDMPDAVGLAVPGMPIGSPGMDGPAYGGQRDAFDVLLVGRDGRTSVFSTYR
jgi:hypothetical protein